MTKFEVCTLVFFVLFLASFMTKVEHEISLPNPVTKRCVIIHSGVTEVE